MDIIIEEGTVATMSTILIWKSLTSFRKSIVRNTIYSFLKLWMCVRLMATSKRKTFC